jgi:hypothetical protein
MSILSRLFRRDPYPTVTQRRAYLAGVPQAQPYVLSTTREVSDDPVLLRQRLVQQHLAARRRELTGTPIVGVTVEYTEKGGDE